MKVRREKMPPTKQRTYTTHKHTNYSASHIQIERDSGREKAREREKKRSKKEKKM